MPGGITPISQLEIKRMATVRLPLLKEYREKRGWSAIQLSATAGVGRNTGRKAETDPVTPGVARKLASALGVSVELLKGQKTFLDQNI